MFRRLMACTVLVAALAACSESTPPPAAPAVSAPAAPASSIPAATPATAPEAAATTPAAPDAAAAVAGEAPAGPPPRPGTDYVVLPVPQPTFGQGRIEVAEVFAYTCVHCAQFQPVVNIWKPRLPSDARWQYVPAVFGGAQDTFARAFFAAEALGVQERTHDAVFDAVFVKKTLTGGSEDAIADLYASLGVDRKQFIDTMNSFGVTAKVNRAKQFAMRTEVNATPTIVVNGKYRVNSTPDRGFEGMFSTVHYLIALERGAAQATATAATPAAEPAPAQ